MTSAKSRITWAATYVGWLNRAGILFLLAVLEPVAVSIHLQNVNMVGQTAIAQVLSGSGGPPTAALTTATISRK